MPGAATKCGPESAPYRIKLNRGDHLDSWRMVLQQYIHKQSTKLDLLLQSSCRSCHREASKRLYQCTRFTTANQEVVVSGSRIFTYDGAAHRSTARNTTHHLQSKTLASEDT